MPDRGGGDARRFFDFTYAYRFGPPAHDVVLAPLHADHDSTGTPLSQAVYLPDQDWFHLGPGETRLIRLMHESGAATAAGAIPSGEIYAINADRPASYDAPSA
ncbi:conserved hypothetical protein [Cupriavidus taiwanensis]|nr:conserved hypothetical protein [Cupriavidus taiwanensis]SOY96136.1 conserved hypothetical protein [Cupriavidus taiwanensis]